MRFYFYTLLLSVLLATVNTAFAQSIEWQNNIGGNQADQMRVIAAAADGGALLGGWSESYISGDKTDNIHGVRDYWIIKLDASGNIEWQKSIGGSSSDYMESAEQTSDGGYILGGWSSSDISGDKTENCQGVFNYWVVKIDDIGNIQWQNTIGGNNTDRLKSVRQTADGGYICGGESSSNQTFDKNEGCWGGLDYWVVKLDSVGAIEWQNTIGGTQDDRLYSVCQSADGGYLVGGSSKSGISGKKTEPNLGAEDYWIVKLNSNGAIQWQNTIGGSGWDEIHAIEQTNDEGFVLGGFSGSSLSGDKTENSQGDLDFWIVKVDTAGAIQWQNTIGGNWTDRLYSLQQTVDGGYIAAGWSGSPVSGDKTNDLIGNTMDYWIMKLDAEGRIDWQNAFGGNSTDTPYSVSELMDGGYLVGGESASDSSGSKTENCQGNWDYWVVKVENKFNLVKGMVFADQNLNGIKDPTEPPIIYQHVTESNTGRFGISDANGFYTLSVADSGSYQVSPALSNNYYTPVPGNHAVSFSGILQTDSLNNFAFQPAGLFNDLLVTLTPATPFRSGMSAGYKLNYSNRGTTTLNPTVVFYPDKSSFISSIPAPANVTPDSVIFALGALAPFESGQITITVNVDFGLIFGTLIDAAATIFPLAGDANPVDNQNNFPHFTTGSYDPNDILVNRDTVFENELITPPWLEYIVRFQNTGNDTAFYVKVANKISADLQLASFEMIDASHPCVVSYSNFDSTMKFTFNNILLPDSNINEIMSHGFVRYRIKPESTLVNGDSVQNTALIYFDYNAPVITNTAFTEIVDLTAIKEITSDPISIFPNPASTELFVECDLSDPRPITIDLYNIYGQQVRELHSGMLNAGKWKQKFDVSDLKQGVYFIVVRGKNLTAHRFVKM